jgi:hypothetical protein
MTICYGVHCAHNPPTGFTTGADLWPDTTPADTIDYG